MMLDFLYELLYKNNAWILTGSLLWGIASVVLSPCHWTAIPLLVGWINKNKKNNKSTFVYSTLFSVGIFCSIILLGIITGLVGRILGDLGLLGDIFMILILIYFGLVIIEIVPVRFSLINANGNLSQKTAFLNGLLFGTGLGPCTFAFMAPILGILLTTMQEQVALSFGIVFMFALGHCGIIVGLAMISKSILGRFQKGIIVGKIVKFSSGFILLGYALYKAIHLVRIL